MTAPWRAHIKPYRAGNSLRGVRRARAAGYLGIDLDLNVTKDGIVVVTHWDRPGLREGFTAPGVPRTAKISNLTWAQVKTLTTRDGYRIQRLETILAECARLGIVACLEPKPGPGWTSASRWKHIREAADQAHATVQVTTVVGGATRTRAVDAVARRAGFPGWHKPKARPAVWPPPAAAKKLTGTINERVVARARALGGNVQTRKDWGTKRADTYAARRRYRPVKQHVDTLVQHITVTFDDGVLTGDFRADMREVERIGYERFRSGVSYNWCVDMSTGMIGEGQPLDAKGTHTVNLKRRPGFSYDQNKVARAVAVIGVPSSKLTARGREGIAIIYAAMIIEGALTADPDYLPHSYFASKDCPCDSTRDAMPAIRRRALQLVKEAKK